MFLEEIFESEKFENQSHEAIAILNRDDIIGWLKSVAGFANANGGDLFIGVEDKTNKLIGFNKEDANNERNFFNNKVNEHLTPRPAINISFIEYQINENSRYIIRIKVKESSIKPVILKYNNIPSIFMRREGFTNGATYEEIIEMSIKSKNTQYDILYSDMKYDASNFSNLRSFYERHNNGEKLTEKRLMSLGFMDENGYLANGAQLFLDNYDGKKTEVQCSIFSGFSKGSERIVSINKFNGNITSTIEYIMDFIKQRMNRTIVKLENQRINVDAYPSRALFEGIINAVAHRDYYLDGTQIQIDLFKDRIEISSPGGFYRGDSFGKTYNLSGIISKRRNELISGILVACNVMEAAGTGFDKISEEYACEDDAHKPYIYSSSDHFTLVLPDLTYEKGIENN